MYCYYKSLTVMGDGMCKHQFRIFCVYRLDLILSTASDSSVIYKHNFVFFVTLLRILCNIVNAFSQSTLCLEARWDRTELFTDLRQIFPNKLAYVILCIVQRPNCETDVEISKEALNLVKCHPIACGSGLISSCTFELNKLLLMYFTEPVFLIAVVSMHVQHICSFSIDETFSLTIAQNLSRNVRRRQSQNEGLIVTALNKSICVDSYHQLCTPQFFLKKQKQIKRKACIRTGKKGLSQLLRHPSDVRTSSSY